MAALVRERYEALRIPVELAAAVPGRPNVIATWKGTGGGPRLLVNAHLDTAGPNVGEWVDPYTGEVTTRWTADPFGGEIRDGRIYGRGRPTTNPRSRRRCWRSRRCRQAASASEVI